MVTCPGHRKIDVSPCGTACTSVTRTTTRTQKTRTFKENSGISLSWYWYISTLQRSCVLRILGILVHKLLCMRSKPPCIYQQKVPLSIAVSNSPPYTFIYYVCLDDLLLNLSNFPVSSSSTSARFLLVLRMLLGFGLGVSPAGCCKTSSFVSIFFFSPSLSSMYLL